MITYVGQYTLAELVPAAQLAVTAGSNGINAAIPDLNGRISAMQAQLAALATMPPFPTFPEMIAQASFNLVQLQLAVAVPGLPPPPSLAAVIATFEAMIAALLAVANGINVNLSAVVAVGSALASASAHAFAYQGQRSAFGAEAQAAVNAEVGGTGSTNTWALVLATQSGAAWAGMSQVFRVAP